MASHDYDMGQSYPPYRYLALFGSRNEGLAGNHMGSAEDVWTLTAVYSPICIYTLCVLRIRNRDEAGFLLYRSIQLELELPETGPEIVLDRVSFINGSS